jgi:gas vesicle protein
MGAGVYTIPMSEYYSKAKSLKNSVKEVAEAVQTNFLKKVADNINELDEQDQTYLEGSSPYTSAKTLYTTLTDTHVKNLENMSSFNGQNPLYAIEHNDKEFASQFKAVAEGTNNNEVTARINKLNQTVDNKIMTAELTDFLTSISDQIGDKDWIQRMLLLAKENPTKAWQDLLNDEKFVSAIQRSESVQEFFLTAMVKMESLGNKFNSFSTKVMNSLISSDKFVDFLSKAPVKFQNKVLDIMAKFSDDAISAMNFSGKFVGWVKTICELKPVKFMTKLANTGLGKVITSPWTGVLVDSGFSAFNAYHNKESETYKDLGKSVGGGIIDSITSVGPIEGALMGASFGPWGAFGGFIIGGTMYGSQLIFPDWPDTVKNWAYDGIDKVRDWGTNAKNWINEKANDAKEWGKSVKQQASSVLKTAADNVKKVGESVKQQVSGVVETVSSKAEEVGKNVEAGAKKLVDGAKELLNKIPKISTPNLNWFG